MTEEQLDKIAEEYDWDDLMDALGMTKEEVLEVLYNNGLLDEDVLEELCPL
jgi:hypothetical protein